MWPGEGDREERLAAAIASARRDPPPVYRGDLLTDLPALAAQAPADATLVIFHSSVLAYVASQDRDRFARTVRGLAAVWLSNEAPGVVPGLPLAEFREGTFVLGHGGRTPLAFADGVCMARDRVGGGSAAGAAGFRSGNVELLRGHAFAARPSQTIRG